MVRIVLAPMIAIAQTKMAPTVVRRAANVNFLHRNVAMRRLLIILFTLLALPFGAQARGVTYFKGTIYEALDAALHSSRLLLVEFYAPWSYKSRWAHDNMMNDSLLSRDFVLFSVETTSVEGAQLATTYEVFDYPNILVFNKNGSVIDRIDRTMERLDFRTRLSQMILATDGRSTLQLRQIYMAASDGDKDKLNSLVTKYLASFQGRKLDVSAVMGLFTSTSINYYGSAAFDYMIAHRQAFDSTFLDTKVRELLMESMLGYIAGNDEVSEQEISRVVAISADFSCNDIIAKLARLWRARHNKDAISFIQLLDNIADGLLIKHLYPLVMSLDFVDASTLDKSARKTASRVVEKVASANTSTAKNVVLESLIEKFH